MSRARAGFTIPELLVAIILLTVGLLAMLGSSVLDTRAIMRERNIDFGAIYAARRLELLRIDACRHPVDSSEILMRGADSLASNTWSFTPTRDASNSVDGYRIRLLSRYFKAPVNMYGSTQSAAAATRRTDTLEAAIVCAR
jgi:prepilin-type N-terminal cleavage/methylation domain-containing protein